MVESLGVTEKQPTITRGDLFWIPSDVLRPRVSGEPHPYLVVQDDVFNRSRIPSLIVCGLSSQMRRAQEPGNVLLAPEEGNLPRQSVVIVSQICVVDKSDLGVYIGRLSLQRVEQVLSGLRFQQRNMAARER